MLFQQIKCLEVGRKGREVIRRANNGTAGEGDALAKLKWATPRSGLPTKRVYEVFELNLFM
jgi:hypothetical protein